MRGKSVQEDSSTRGGSKRVGSGLWVVCVLAVCVAITGVSSDAGASTRLEAAGAQKSKSTAHQAAMGRQSIL